MGLSRRDFLRLGALAAATGAATACHGRPPYLPTFPSGNDVTPTPWPTPPPISAPPAAISREARLLNRAGYGPRPGDVERVQAMGFEAYLEQQLNPETLPDTTWESIAAGLPFYHQSLPDLLAIREEERAGLLTDLYIVTLGAALYSERQLYAAMVEFWSDHFYIYLRKNEAMLPLKLVDDRDVIRPHALGNFRDLLVASAHSPAMLAYLDNAFNRRGAPNENYARELLELHTLGVVSGYTQNDVLETARALTGWTVPRTALESNTGPVQATLVPLLHDDDAKTILGHTFPAHQGEQDIWQLLDMLASHPATAHHIATKLVRRFVADEPPPALTQEVAQTFLNSGGDIKAMLRVIFLSEAFATAPAKLKRPYHYLLSALRGLAVRPGADSDIGRWLNAMGQTLFGWPAPNGYPDVAAAWQHNLLPRWNFALALCQGVNPTLTPPWDELRLALGTTHVNTLLQAFGRWLWQRELDADTLAGLHDYIGADQLDTDEAEARWREAVALLLAAPPFQWM